MRVPGKSTVLTFLLGTFVAGLTTRQVAAQGLEYVKSHYTKFDYQVPMRDGVTLFTSVYAPKDHSQKYPILINRTPYSARPYGVDRYRPDLGPSESFAKEGYIFVYQDVRGRWMSEGDFVHVRPNVARSGGDKSIDDSTDAWDTIDWLTKKLENHNGRVGVWGISYPGYYTSASLINAHPALKAASPQAPVTDWFVGDDWHHNGAFFLTHAFNFMARFGRPRPEPTKKFDFVFDHGTPDAYEFFLRLGPLSNAEKTHFKGEVSFWKELMEHGSYDEFWKARNLRQHLKEIRPAVLTVGGWFDAENLFGALETYRSIESQSPNASNTLVMGPWIHGGWARGTGESLGSVQFNAKTSSYYQETIEFPFFEYYLKDKGKAVHPEAWVFITGKNEWSQFSAWPPRNAKPRSLVFLPKGRLAIDGSTDEALDQDSKAHDDYVSDPDRPVPYIADIAPEMKKEYMIADQRFASRRPDVLTYSTAVLEEDVTIVGPINAKLHVSTSGTDSDWVVKLIDVYPDDFPDPEKNPTGERMGGYQQLVRGDVIRGKFRNGLDRPEAFTPDQPTPVNFTLPDTGHTFRPGHRIMVQIQSSWFPLVDRNPQKFMDIYSAKESDFQKANQKVYRSKEHPSHIEVLVLP
ncbi:CocE/NonD family hydrolase [Singulisphaera sp. Ch08]|uniref:CocE/NonD family hydrolase n=1 Tax=Singulisphaera sp. Ch08 TaxID=3120278 RepID=A0AAU7CEA6_9BACT